MSAEAPCVVCGGTFPLARMDIAEHGYACLGCSQQAVILEHERAAHQDLRDHNRAVTILAAPRFWNITFHCVQCDEELPRGPGLFRFTLPPRELQCARCGTQCGMSFVHRANWTLALLFKPAILVALAARYSSLSAAITSRSTTAILVELMIALIFAFLGAALLALPVTFVLDRTRRAAE